MEEFISFKGEAFSIHSCPGVSNLPTRRALLSVLAGMEKTLLAGGVPQATCECHDERGLLFIPKDGTRFNIPSTMSPGHF